MVIRRTIIMTPPNTSGKAEQSSDVFAAGQRLARYHAAAP
jgi:hypothetical protein